MAKEKTNEHIVTGTKPYIVMGKVQFFWTMIVGIVALLLGIYFIIIGNQKMVGLGFAVFGFAICILLLAQKENSIGRIK